MLFLFCIALCAGLLSCLFVFSSREVNPRFYRTQFLIVLGLMTIALLVRPLWVNSLLAGMICIELGFAFLGVFSWSMEGAPGGNVCMWLNVLWVLPMVGAACALGALGRISAVIVASAYTSALLLGAATTAMLMGHSYLTSPSMSLRPLLNLLKVFFGSLLIRLALSCFVTWRWASQHHFTELDTEATLWLAMRWIVGLVAPLVLVFLSWQTTKIRSTQSATGILYVAVVFCFIGELTSQLLVTSSRFHLL